MASDLLFDILKHIGRKGEVRLMEELKACNVPFTDLTDQFLPFDIETEHALIDAKKCKRKKHWLQFYPKFTEWDAFQSDKRKLVALVANKKPIYLLDIDMIPSFAYFLTYGRVVVEYQHLLPMSKYLNIL